MKKFWQRNKQAIVFIFTLITVWRLVLFIPDFLGVFFLQQRVGFIGPTPWANFDGMHYLSIAQNGYFQFEQAFFPLFPVLIKIVSVITSGDYTWAGMVIVYASFFLWLFFFYKLLEMDYKTSVIRWTLIFTLFFPTAFFFVSLYTEPFFLLLVILTFYLIRKKQWIAAGIMVGLASATKLVGIFLLPALLIEFYLVYKREVFSKNHLLKMCLMTIVSTSGLILYMLYLWKTYADPLFFIHAQPAFGANRSGGDIILLPQVLYRYIKIFFTVPFTNYDAWIALLEVSMLLFAFGLLIFGFLKRKIRLSYFFFSILAIVGPTLTGSLSSIPRYLLVAFPLFIVLGTIKNTQIKTVIVFISACFFILLCMYFLRGYFIA